MSFLEELQKQKSKLKETETVVTKVNGERYIDNYSKIKPIYPYTYGFVVDNKPDKSPALILEHFYIGSQDCTAFDVINSYNIQHVLSLGIKVDDVDVDNKFVECLDLPESKIKEILPECLPYIRKAIQSKVNVLVHCNAGVSRCSAVAIAYLMHYHIMEFDDAFSIVKNKRPAILPNRGFKRQLMAMKPGELI